MAAEFEGMACAARPISAGNVIFSENRKLRLLLPDAGYFRAAMAASPVLQVHLPEAVAGALDDQLAAVVAEGALRLISREVADIDVFQARFQRGFPGLLQGAHRRGVVVLHLVEGVKPGEVQRREGPQLVFDPGAHALQGLRLVV